MHSQGPLNREEEGRRVRVRAMQPETQHVIGGLHGGRGPGAKECGQLVEAGKHGGRDSPLGPPERTTALLFPVRTSPSATASSPPGKFQH